VEWSDTFLTFYMKGSTTENKAWRQAIGAWPARGDGRGMDVHRAEFHPEDIGIGTIDIPWITETYPGNLGWSHHFHIKTTVDWSGFKPYLDQLSPELQALIRDEL
jgi:hypothetical protein